jgi:hypothetical protein
MTKRAAAVAIKGMTADEKSKIYLERYENAHPGKLRELQKEWYVRNRDTVTSRKRTEYAEQKAIGDTYYQRNTERIKARQRELYAEKKQRKQLALAE